ncbi:MAG: S41 family peptidase [Planctomycetota bacterium]|jgi:carboxyl-terminal processing protease
MTQSKLTNHLFVVIVCLWGVVGSPVQAQDQPLTIKQWSELVWESARKGDREALDVYLGQIPPRPDNDHARRVRAALDQHLDNVQEAMVNRNEGRAAARDRMGDHFGRGQISQALTAAVEVQTLSEDLRSALDDPDMGDVVAEAKSRVPVARRDGDWLFAYELVYRLNVLFEHTGEYERELERVNRRLALLSYYAPRRLHELRNRQAERFDEEPLKEFNPALVEDWKQRLLGMDHKMVRRALEKAAREHIEGQGWRPLLKGGLESLRMLATTPALAETFPNLKDAAKVNGWIDFLDDRLLQLARTPDEDLGYRTCNRLLDAVIEKSEETVGLPRGVILREFGDGAMQALDQFTEVVWPNKLHRFRQSTHGSFVGVGILIRHDEKRDIMVVSPLEGTPAYFAGVKPDDRIVQVDGGSTVGWSLNDAVDRITGPKGTEVRLGIRREGFDEVIQITIVRDVIKIRSVKGWWKTGLSETGDPTWDWFIDPDTRIAYIRLSAFNEDTNEDLQAAWQDITADGKPNGLILDLRYNPGGLLTSAVDVSNLFVRNGVIVSGETKDERKAWPDRRAEPNKAMIAEDGVATVVLINQGSASASEIVAGCLQAHGAAVVVGKRSYGKGSVQTVHPIARKALLKLTTQYYRLPPTAVQRARGVKGRLVHRRPGAETWGVDPDIEVNTTPQEIKAAYDLRQAADILALNEAGEPAERPDINDLLAKGLDPQLETAVLILQAKALGTTVAETRHAMAN